MLGPVGVTLHSSRFVLFAEDEDTVQRNTTKTGTGVRERTRPQTQTLKGQCPLSGKAISGLFNNIPKLH